MQPMQVDSGKTTTDDVIRIGDVNVVVKDVGKKPMVLENRLKLIPRRVCWPMITRPAVVARQASTTSLGGARRV